jgi:hypothetical protein
LATRLPVNKEAIRTELIDRMKAASGYLLNNIGAAVGGVTTILVTGLLVTVFLYFLLRYGKDWIGRLAVLTPLDPCTTASILRTVNDSVVANVNGVFAVAVGQGLLLSLGFWFVGVRSPVLWGAVGGLASIIPLVGALLVWVPVAIAFLLMGSYWKALLLGLPRGGFRGQRAAGVCGRCARKATPDAHCAGGNWRHVRIRPPGNSLGPPGRFSSRCSAEGDSKVGLAPVQSQQHTPGDEGAGLAAGPALG